MTMIPDPRYMESRACVQGLISEACEATKRTEVAACAELVRAAGCLCRSLWLASRRARHTCAYDGEYRYDGDDFTVTRHDSRCPEALAARIEARGKE